MKKKTIIIVSIISGLALFGTGSLVGAQTLSWKDQISVNAASSIDSAGKAKADALTTNVQASIESAVEQKVNPIIDAKKQDMTNQLQSYFDQKTSTITDSQDYKDAVADLDRIESVLLTQYKAQIDAAFSGQ